MRRTNTTINTTTPFVTSYSYKDHASEYNRTSTQLQAISYSNNKGFKYTYDANGNITSIRDINNNIIAEYEYDALNQLVGEYNGYLNKTYTYIYDNGGNIIDVIEYSHATGLSTQKSYTYGDSQWRDLLTNYNGTNLTYDAIGNPLNWINGESFTWSGGRQLIGITKGNNTIAYTYNDSGIRTSKTVNNVRTDYYLNGTAIIMQKTGDNVIWYTYDENGLVTGFRYNGAEYYYFRNAQNDIIGIVDSSGTVVANYTYDSWGNHIAITDGNGNNVASNPNHIANINPFRYRGYYFDTETGLYYLNSRYYDANVGRFINADGYVSTGQGVTGNNMFAYCGNNTITNKDCLGTRFCEATTISEESSTERSLLCKMQKATVLDLIEREKQTINITTKLNNAMENNAKNLQEYKDEHSLLETVVFFIDKVKPGGEWDFKSQESWNLNASKTYKYNNVTLRYDDIGNIHYGYVGRVLFSEENLLKAGGFVQICTKSSKIKYYKTNFDDPRDQWAISLGSALWDMG